jgi:DNA-binding response OmpR family regulator
LVPFLLTTLDIMRERDRILVVDDDRDACELFVLVLEEAGYAVDSADSGFQALSLVSSKHPDLVLTDLQMPGMSGLELIRRIRSFDAGVPVVLTTGLETRDLCTGARAYGAEACLEKPVNLDELLWTIDCALTCRRQQREQAGASPAAASAR